MPISVRNDVAGHFGVPNSDFSLKQDTDNFSSGSYLGRIRDPIAERNIRRLLDDAGITWGILAPVLTTIPALVPLVALTVAFPTPTNITLLATTAAGSPAAVAAITAWADQKNLQKRLVREMARNFGLRTQSDVDMFDDYWHMIFDGRKFAKDQKTLIDADLSEAYVMLARVAAAETSIRVPGTVGADEDPTPVTWKRIADVDQHENYVIFSDHHFTNVGGTASRLNFAKTDNLDLYLSVLDHYADAEDWCLVENGDVEECVIFEPDAADAAIRKATRQDMPVVLDGDEGEIWQPFLDQRYAKRREALADVFSGFSAYYDKIRTRFLGDNPRYVRLTGNHDTYSETRHEDTLLQMINDQLPGVEINDILRIRRNGQVTHVVMHGHQFDRVSIQHGPVKFALSCGETFSEATAWTNEGPDRYWDRADANGWIHGNSFRNHLAREEPIGGLPVDSAILALAGIFFNAAGASIDVRQDTKKLVESMMRHEIGWEYYDNRDAFNALALEVLTGDEAFKFRHLNEIDLVEIYATAYDALSAGWDIPKVVLGHTHEPRQGSVAGTIAPVPYYLNSGSAGRFRNLIWCVEVTPSEDRIVSWSRVNSRLQRRVLVPQNTTIDVPTGTFPPTMQTHNASRLVPMEPTFHPL